MQTRIWVLGVVLTVGFTAACEQDSPRAPWEYGSPDADFDADVGTDDGGVGDDADARPGDAGDVYDPNWGWDVELPPEMSESPALPDERPDITACGQTGWWCWLHPRPFAHRIEELGGVDGRIHAAVQEPTVRQFQGMILQDGEYTLLRRPWQIVGHIDSMLPADTGFLGLQDHGAVEFFGPEGFRGGLSLRREGFSHISGNSMDNFIATRDEGGGVLKRNGETRRYDSLPGHPLQYEMWSNGTITSMVQDQEAQMSSGNGARLFPLPPGADPSKTRPFGPDPTSDCAGAGIWTTSGGDTVYRWSESDGRWKTSSYDGPPVTAFSCGPGGGLVAADEGGGIAWRENGQWRRQQVVRWAIRDVAAAGRRIVAGGRAGNLVILSEGSISRQSQGFRVPEPADNLDGRYGYSDVWVGGKKMVLVHTTGLFYGDDEGWSRMPIEDERALGAQWGEEVWGVDEPKFFLSRWGMYEWTGSTWVGVDSKLGPNTAGANNDLEGSSEDDVWACSGDKISRYDGETWSLVTTPDSDVTTKLAEDDLDIDTLYERDNGDMLLAASGNIYAIVGSPGSWDLEHRLDTPCSHIVDLHYDDSGSPYVLGREECFAHHSQGDWKTWDHPPPRNHPPYHTGFQWDYRELVPEPNDSPRIASKVGILDPRDGIDFDIEFVGSIVDATYSPAIKATIALQRRGVVVKHHF